MERANQREEGLLGGEVFCHLYDTAELDIKPQMNITQLSAVNGKA